MEHLKGNADRAICKGIHMSDKSNKWFSRFLGGGRSDEPGIPEATKPAKAEQADMLAIPGSPPLQRTRDEILAAEAEVPLEWRVGDVILDLYEVKQIHESGGMGLVYRVHHRGWNMDLAVKSPRANYFEIQERKNNFIRECVTWINLGLHPHIACCFYVRTLGGIPRIFAEYVEGGSLKDWIESGRLYQGAQKESLMRILDIMIQMAWGLLYAHENGLVHQDVKPANVLLIPERSRGSDASAKADAGQYVTAKITDFGLAKARVAADEKYLPGSGQSILVSTGFMTPAYCSPEQKQGKPLSHRTDIWSWAVSVLEMFTGEVTWMSGQAAGEALQGFLQLETDSGMIPPMPDSLGKVLRWCFRQHPAERPNSFREVVSSLQDLFYEQFGEEYGRTEPKAVDLSADSLNNRALSLLDIGMPDQAERAWAEALGIDKVHLESTYNLGLIMWRSARMDDVEVLRLLRECALGTSNSWRSKLMIARVHLERGDCESVIGEMGSLKDRDMRRKEILPVLQKAREYLQVSRRRLQTFNGHRSLVETVCISMDARWALSGSWDKTLKLWNVMTGRCLRTFAGHKFKVSSVCLSGDGRSALSSDENGTLKLCEVATGRCVRTFEDTEESIFSVSLNVDGRWALSGGSHPTLKFWDVANGNCVRAFEGHKGKIGSVHLSRDGRWALSGSWDKTLKLWDMKTGRCLRTFDEHEGIVTSVSLSRDGLQALSGSTDQTLKLWDVATGQCVRTFRGHRGSVNSVSLSFDGQWALSGSADETLKLWGMASGRCLRTFEGHRKDVITICLSSNGDWAMSGGADAELNLWDLAPHQVWPLVALEPSRPTLSERAIQMNRRYRAEVGASQLAAGNGLYVEAANLLRKARSIDGYGRQKEVVDLWADLYRHLPKKQLSYAWEKTIFQGHTGKVTSLCLSSDNRSVLSGSTDQTLKLWDVATGQCVRTFKGHTDTVNSVSLSFDGQRALSGSADKTLKLWDIATGRCVRTLGRYIYGVSSVFLSGDGRWALSGGRHGGLRLWEVETGRCLRVFGGERESVFSVYLSVDARWALTGGHGHTLKLWDVATGHCVRTFAQHGYGEVESVCLSYDSHWALSGGFDETLKLWEMATGRCLRTFTGHTGGVNSVCLSTDARWALSGSWDQTLKLWDVINGRCLRTFESHIGRVNSALLSYDGRWALSGGSTEMLKLWFLDWELEERQPEDWDEGARSYLKAFLTLHTPYVASLPVRGQPAEEQIVKALTRRGKPSWAEADFQQLLYTLGCAGYGWLRPNGVRRELQKMAAKWNGPPPLQWEKEG